MVRSAILCLVGLLVGCDVPPAGTRDAAASDSGAPIDARVMDAAGVDAAGADAAGADAADPLGTWRKRK